MKNNCEKIAQPSIGIIISIIIIVCVRLPLLALLERKKKELMDFDEFTKYIITRGLINSYLIYGMCHVFELVFHLYSPRSRYFEVPCSFFLLVFIFGDSFLVFMFVIACIASCLFFSYSKVCLTPKLKNKNTDPCSLWLSYTYLFLPPFRVRLPIPTSHLSWKDFLPLPSSKFRVSPLFSRQYFPIQSYPIQAEHNNPFLLSTHAYLCSIRS